MKNITNSIILGLCLAIIGSASVKALDTEYKSYKKVSHNVDYFEIVYNKSTIDIYAFDGDDRTDGLKFYQRDLSIQNNKVFVDGELLCDKKGLHIDGDLLDWDDIWDIRISDKVNKTVITFRKREGDATTASSRRRGNIIQYSRDVTIDDKEFVRGVVFTVLGNIHVEGEVSHDVVSLFGDIRLSNDAVARGDVATVAGEIDISGSVSVYGEVFETDNKRRVSKKRRGRFYRNAHESDATAGFIYNRVDGAHPWFQYEFSDGDSLLPTVTVRGGYAFNSQRWRYDFSLEQTLLRSMPLAVGVGLHRRLDSDDTGLLDITENTVFALIAHEDLMDYYEAEGGRVYLRAKPLKNLTAESGYQQDKTKWLSARKDLWSLFGGDKTFSNNFSSVDEALRSGLSEEIDTTTIASAYVKLDYDDRRRSLPFAYNAWVATAKAEWSDPDISSDFDFARYSADITRFQRLNRRAMMVFRIRYGESDGDLPMHRRFYVGGLGTLRGYKHKEFSGSKFWLGNVEYRFGLPGSELGFGLIYDVAQITDNENLTSETEMLHSLGASVYIGDDFRIILAKRLDRSHDDNPIFYVRLSGIL